MIDSPETLAVIAAVVDTYPKWATLSRTVIGFGLAVYLLGVGLALARTVKRARGLVGSGDGETGDSEHPGDPGDPGDGPDPEGGD